MAVPCELTTVMDPNVRYDENCDRILSTKEKIFLFLEHVISFLTDAKTLIFFFLVIIGVWAYRAKTHPNGAAMNAYKKGLSFLRGNRILVLFGLGVSMIILPLMMPNDNLLKSAIENDVSYWIAVSLSTFLGIRYGIIICIGIVLVAYSLAKLRNNTKL